MYTPTFVDVPAAATTTTNNYADSHTPRRAANVTGLARVPRVSPRTQNRLSASSAPTSYAFSPSYTSTPIPTHPHALIPAHVPCQPRAVDVFEERQAMYALAARAFDACFHRTDFATEGSVLPACPPMERYMGARPLRG